MDCDLHNGDCLEIMQNIKPSSIDLVLCDPPYGTTSIYWDSVIDFETLWLEYAVICKPTTPIVLFACQPFTTHLITSNLDMFKYCWIWLKNKPTGISSASYAPMKYTEDVVVFYKKKPIFNKQMIQREGKGKDYYKYEHYCGNNNHVKMKKVKKFYDEDLVNPSNLLLFNTVPNRKNKLHPTQKPVDLLEYFIKTYTNEGDTVLDNCMGSGSTGVACKNLNRNFIGIESDKNYFETASKRIKTHIPNLIG